MADSNITKKALAKALKELMEEKSFEKINIGDICERCEMNRKSFYYHFKDKYDLVNWIFDMEFITVVHTHGHKNTWEMMKLVCEFFYENRNFYRKALSIKGQNSFSEHFRDILFPLISNRFRETLDEKEVQEFQVTFISDAIVMAFQRWIVENKEMSPEEFVEQMKLSIKYITIRYGDSVQKDSDTR